MRKSLKIFTTCAELALQDIWRVVAFIADSPDNF
jgi:hypothetical protein